MKPVHASILLVVVSILESGCAECELGEATCDGDVAVNCGAADGETSLVEHACEAPRSCVVEGGHAICVLGKSSACRAGAGNVCDGSDQLHCSGEWVTSRLPCKTCDTAREESCEQGTGAACMSDADCLDGYICFGLPDEPRICGHECDVAVCETCNIAEVDGQTQRACF